MTYALYRSLMDRAGLPPKSEEKWRDSVERYGGSWDPSQHPRGQPENAGEFAPKLGGSTREDVAPVLSRASRRTGLTGPEIVRVVKGWADWDDMIQRIDQLAEQHGDKPHYWEPEPSEETGDPAFFTTGDWETDEQRETRRAAWVARWGTRQRFRDELSKSTTVTDPGQRRAYLGYVQDVLWFMPPNAAKALAARVTSVGFHRSVQELTASVHQGESEPGAVVGGAFSQNERMGWRILHLDGGYQGDGQYEDNRDARGIYAHEFGHALDWQEAKGWEPAKRISHTAEWMQAWELEIRDGHLSEYAKTSSSEGFAEFARLCYSNEKRYARESFPNCWKVFATHGLV